MGSDTSSINPRVLRLNFAIPKNLEGENIKTMLNVNALHITIWIAFTAKFAPS